MSVLGNKADSLQVLRSGWILAYLYSPLVHSTKLTAMKLFVAGLPYDMDDTELTEFFDKFGTVSSAKVTMDKETGKSRGFAFVEMPNDQEAREAIEGLNNLGIGKKVMVVKPAEDRRTAAPGPTDRRPRTYPSARPPRSDY